MTDTKGGLYFMLILDQTYVESHLDAVSCVALMEQTLRQETEKTCIQYLRTAIPLPNTNVLGLMPGWFDGYFGVKTISVYHTNQGSGYPSHQGQVLLFESEHGSLLAGVDATSVTRIRTGAVSAVASKALARPDSSHLCILGCGAQGESHLEALLPFFPIRKITLWDMFPESAARLAQTAHRLTEASGLGTVEIKVCSNAREAVCDADIICTLTPSKTPVLCGQWLKPGAHVNAVGACAPDARELDSDAVAASSFFGDNISSVEHESGDYLFPLKEGRITREHLKGTLGEVLTGRIEGRRSNDEITIFEALGMAVEDIAAAQYLYRMHEARHRLPGSDQIADASAQDPAWVSKLRSHFPVTKDWAFFDIAYENCGADYMEDALAEYFKDKVTLSPGMIKAGGSGKGNTIDVIHETRSLLARFLNAPDSRNIAFTLNTTQGMNLLLQSLSLKEGDSIVVSDIEHVAVLMPCLHLREKGVDVRIAHSENGLWATQEELLAMADETTKVIAVSYVQSSSGYRLDLASLAAEAHSRGILVLADVIQALGVLALDVQTLGADGIAACCYKGMLAAEGVGFVWCSDALLKHLHPVFAGANEATRFDRSTVSMQIDQTDARKLEAGTLPFSSIYMLRAGLVRLLSVGMDSIGMHVARCLTQLQDGLEKAGVQVCVPDQQKNRCNSLLICETKNQELTDYLARHDVFISCSKPGYVRVSVAPFTTKADIDRLLFIMNKWLHEGSANHDR